MVLFGVGLGWVGVCFYIIIVGSFFVVIFFWGSE